MADRDSLLQEFIAVSGADESRARFFLQAANWELPVALETFFDGGQPVEDMDDDIEEEVISRPVAAPNPVPNPSSSKSKPQQKASSGPRRFGTINDFGSNSSKNEEAEDSDEEKQAFYAGGGAHGGSGQQVLGPPGKKKDPNKMIEELFKAAKDAGAEEVDPSCCDKPQNTRKAFQGQGFRLGQTEDDHVSVGVPLASDPRANLPENLEVTLKMWSNGFSLGDGALRSYEDPEGREFINSIKRGEIPNELLVQAKGGEVGLSMEDHRQEEYTAPKPKFKAFSGGGQRLGSPDVGGSSAPPPPAPVAAPDPSAAGEFFLAVDDSAPTTTLQIRLADGSRLTGRFNHTHLVKDIRAYIIGSRPQFANANFVLMTTFPNKELSDQEVSLADGNLLNAVIVMRLR